LVTVPEIFDQLQAQLAKSKIVAEWYVMPQFNGFAALTGETADVYCLELDIGPIPQHPNWHLFGMVQSFSRRYPNLSLATLAVLDQATGEPQDYPMIFGLLNDWKFTAITLPLLQRAFGPLDPKGKGRSQMVERYTNSRLPLVNFLPTTIYSSKLVLSRAGSGQHATIAADYDDPLIKIVGRMLMPLARYTSLNIFPAEAGESPLLVPTRQRQAPQSAPYVLKSSPALDRAFATALQYLNAD
jgi:hypothetical protein